MYNILMIMVWKDISTVILICYISSSVECWEESDTPMIMIISVLCMRAYLGVTKVFIIASLGTRGQHLGVGWLLMFPLTTSTSHCSSQQKQIKWQFYFREVGNFQTCLNFPDPSSFSSFSESSEPILGSRNCGSLLDVEYIILSSLLARVKTKWNKGSGVN